MMKNFSLTGLIGSSRKNSYKQESPFNVSNYVSKNEKKEVNLYLFFDLLQISYKIFSTTPKKSIYILVGETPSYLYPFLHFFTAAESNKLYLLCFSNKPYSLFAVPNNDLNGIDCVDNDTLYNSALKNREKILSNNSEAVHNATLTENYYFEYLEKNTFLTRDFIKKNWNNLILIDLSSGPSISGVSVFFNRYVGNIVGNKICNIKGAKPLKFINLAYNYVNIAPLISKSMIDEQENIIDNNQNLSPYLYYNYDPNLIIVLNSIRFLHFWDFVTYESFPRLTCDYPATLWKNKPFLYNKGLDALEILHDLVVNYHKFRKNKDDEETVNNIYNILKKMPYTKKYFKNSTKKNRKIIIDNLFIKINTNVIIAKYDNIYDDDPNYI